MTNKEWALKMIPVLVRWAQGAWDKPHYYSDLTAAVGHKTNHIGNVMGIIQDIIDDLQKQSGKNILLQRNKKREYGCHSGEGYSEKYTNIFL